MPSVINLLTQKAFSWTKLVLNNIWNDRAEGKQSNAAEPSLYHKFYTKYSARELICEFVCILDVSLIETLL